MAENALLSVRGEAQRTVAPDFVSLHCLLGASGSSKGDALALVRTAQQRLIGLLSGLGGTVLTVQTERGALTWSLGSIGTQDEHDFDKATGRHGPTGQIIANAAVVVTARDLALLSQLADALASVDQLHINAVSWHVDGDNPAWRDVRAAAIADAISKGRDYAEALDGTVTKVDHVADAGLLGAGQGPFFARAASLSGAGIAASGVPGDSPSLDPVPQEISAVVEARLVAQLPTLK